MERPFSHGIGVPVLSRPATTTAHGITAELLAVRLTEPLAAKVNISSQLRDTVPTPSRKPQPASPLSGRGRGAIYLQTLGNRVYPLGEHPKVSLIPNSHHPRLHRVFDPPPIRHALEHDKHNSLSRRNRDLHDHSPNGLILARAASPSVWSHSTEGLL